VRITLRRNNCVCGHADTICGSTPTLQATAGPTATNFYLVTKWSRLAVNFAKQPELLKRSVSMRSRLSYNTLEDEALGAKLRYG